MGNETHPALGRLGMRAAGHPVPAAGEEVETVAARLARWLAMRIAAWRRDHHRNASRRHVIRAERHRDMSERWSRQFDRLWVIRQRRRFALVKSQREGGR